MIVILASNFFVMLSFFCSKQDVSDLWKNLQINNKPHSIAHEHWKYFYLLINLYYYFQYVFTPFTD